MEDRGGYIWVPYQEWLGQNIPNPRYGIATPFPWFVNHYTPNQEAKSYNDAVRLLRDIWNFHTYSAEGSGWGWIGYNTIQHGRYIFEGAGLGNRGIHAPGANGQSHGHAHLVSERNVTDEEWLALRYFVRDLVSGGYIQPQVLTNPTYFTHHGDWISTTCSGPVKNTASHFYTVKEEVTVVTSPSRNRMDLVKVDGNGQVFHQAHINGAYTGWAHLSGVAVEGPVDMVWHGTYLHFFAIERGTGRPMQRSWLEHEFGTLKGDWSFGGVWYPVDTSNGNRSISALAS